MIARFPSPLHQIDCILDDQRGGKESSKLGSVPCESMAVGTVELVTVH
jgi:hypothetical protein